MKDERITRRAMCAAGLVSTGCRVVGSPYFGNTVPPADQQLVYIIGAEPETLDPGRTTGGYESFVVPALFESLINYHPVTAHPMAGLATHYKTNLDQTQFTFYLRGHPSPSGLKLPNTDTLRAEYATGRLREDFARQNTAPLDSIAARWTDQTTITAEDFVYSWRRVVDPETATPQYASFFIHIRNAEDILAGKCSPASLGVRALDQFTFEVDLRAPVPLFHGLISHRVSAPVPHRAVEAARRRGNEFSWTEPRHIVTSGAFTLAEHHRNDQIVLTKSPDYYESQLVALQKIAFLPVVDGTSCANLYKTGAAHAMSGDRLPPLFATAVGPRRDSYKAPAFFHILPGFNVARPPFNNPLLRYALNMATDKEQIARVFGAGRAPARTFVPPIANYKPPRNVTVNLNARSYDVLSYDPDAARELLVSGGFQHGASGDDQPLALEYLFPQLPHSQVIAEILQQQWRQNLNIVVKLVKQDFQTWMYRLLTGDYGMTETGGGADYLDPNAFLELFATGHPLSYSWSDLKYDAMLANANTSTEPAERMKGLAQCETYLLRAMPVVPLLFYGFVGLQKPYVHGLDTNPLDFHPFKYAWIDTNWKPRRR